MTSVGDILPDFGFTVTSNVTGDLTAPSSFSVTLTAPDGTTPSITVTNSATGVYAVTHVATMAGYYRAVGTASGNNCDGVSVLEWNVSAVAPSTIISLADAQQYLNCFDPELEGEIDDVLQAVSEVCERFTKKTWRRQTVVETYTIAEDSDLDVLQLRHQPVVSVTSVVENGVTLTANDYVLDGRQGLLKRGTSLVDIDWLEGFQNVTVTYVTGPPAGVVPANILQGCRLLLHHMWTTQRGNALRGAGTGDDYDPSLGFYIPNRVRQAWGEPRILVR